jgi:hypothetical protein
LSELGFNRLKDAQDVCHDFPVHLLILKILVQDSMTTAPSLKLLSGSFLNLFHPAGIPTNTVCILAQTVCAGSDTTMNGVKVIISISTLMKQPIRLPASISYSMILKKI